MNELWRVRKENREIRDHLRPDFCTAFDGMYRYMRVAAFNAYDIELLRKDLMGMLLEGQQRGETVEEILGSEREPFTKSLLADCQRKSLAEQVLYYLYMGFCYAAVILAVYWVIYERMGWTVSVTATLVVLVSIFVVYALIAEYLLAKLSLLFKKKRVLIFLILLFTYRIMQNWILTFEGWHGAIFTIQWWIPFAVTLIPAGLIYLLYERITVKNANMGKR